MAYSYNFPARLRIIPVISVSITRTFLSKNSKFFLKTNIIVNKQVSRISTSFLVHRLVYFWNHYESFPVKKTIFFVQQRKKKQNYYKSVFLYPAMMFLLIYNLYLIYSSLCGSWIFINMTGSASNVDRCTNHGKCHLT